MKTALDLEIQQQLGFLNPLSVLDQWLKQARVYQHPSYRGSWPMVLSTAYKDKISSRVVLLKEHKKGYLIFYSNYLSEKGKQIDKNPWVAVNFYWKEMAKQIRIEGLLKKISRHQSLSYWKGRSRESQISQWVSKQSQVLESKKKLIELKKQAEKRFFNQEIPCPKPWGGYKIKIQQIEFWLEGKHRLHDRFLFKKQPHKWNAQRLFP